MHYDCVACYFLSLPRRLIDDYGMHARYAFGNNSRQRASCCRVVRPSVR